MRSAAANIALLQPQPRGRHVLQAREQVERHIELQVRYASASMDGETATIAVATDHGHLTLRMHRIVLGALAGTIARALFPKVGDFVPALGPIEMQEFPTQPRSGEPAGDPVDAVPEAEPQNVIIQSGPEETAESGAAVAGVEPENVPTQPEGDPAYRVLEAEPQKVMTQSRPEEPIAEYAAAVAAAEPENVPTQREAEESEHEFSRRSTRYGRGWEGPPLHPPAASTGMFRANPSHAKWKESLPLHSSAPSAKTIGPDPGLSLIISIGARSLICR